MSLLLKRPPLVLSHWPSPGWRFSLNHSGPSQDQIQNDIVRLGWSKQVLSRPPQDVDVLTVLGRLRPGRPRPKNSEKSPYSDVLVLVLEVLVFGRPVPGSPDLRTPGPESVKSQFFTKTRLYRRKMSEITEVDYLTGFLSYKYRKRFTVNPSRRSMYSSLCRIIHYKQVSWVDRNSFIWLLFIIISYFNAIMNIFYKWIESMFFQ